MAFPAYTKHFDELVKLYSHILVINLLAPTKKGEAKLIKAFEANAITYGRVNANKVRYSQFDFHAQRSSSSVIILYIIERRCN